MEVKKHESKDIRFKRTDFFLIGLSTSLLLIFGAFSYTVRDKKGSGLEEFVIPEDLVIMENTVQEKKPPPPPPPPELEVVEDDEEIEEEQPEIEDTEADQDLEMEIYEADEDEPEETNEVFEMYAVEEIASFPGGEAGLQKFLHENIRYPEAAMDAELSGSVMVQFVVNKDGSVSDLVILTPTKGFGLEDEAKRVVRLTSGKWKPAKQRDRPVKMRFMVPINYQLY